MSIRFRHGLLLASALSLCAVPTLRAQPTQAPSRVEPGLEEAVKWKWKVVPSDERAWGLELPEPPPTQPTGTAPSPLFPTSAENSYEVKKGDALILIAKKHGRTVAQLKAANGLQSDIIRVGQILKIPTPEECIALGLPIAEPTPPPAPKKPGTPPAPSASGPIDQEVLLLQIFLDREQFSAGPIDGKTSLPFQKLVYLYQTTRPDAADFETLKTRALSRVGELTSTYTLKAADFRFIAPPKAEKKSDADPKKKSSSGPAVPPPPTYEDMIHSTMLAYRSPWEFVAERFHCSEELLHALNPTLGSIPPAGTTFRVPNVVPFAIERAFDPPIQPTPNPSNVVTAVIVDLSRLEIYSNGSLDAVMPVSAARPGLRGRGTWTILDAIPRPRLATLQEPREGPKPVSNFFTGENASPTPLPAGLNTEQFLPPGPNNPVGIFWINLAKSDSPDPLPFGLHGTSIPGQMTLRSSLGGFRLTNWDIARAVRLLPKGTPLQWKVGVMPSPQTAKPAL